MDIFIKIYNRLCKFFLKSLPYLTVIIIGFLFIWISNLYPNYKDLFIGISSTSFSILFVIFIFESVQYFSNKKLSKEIHDYVNFKSGRVIMDMLHRLQRLIYLDNLKPTELKDFKKMSDYTETILEEIILNKEFLGFDIFISWDKYIQEIELILDNSLISKNLTSEQTIWLLSIYKRIKTFGRIIDDGYDNIFILVKRNNNPDIEIAKNKDFAYYLKYKGNLIQSAYCDSQREDKLTNIYKVNSEAALALARTIIKMINYFDKNPLFKKELILDPQAVKIVKKSAIESR
ncbi:hypothetical protein [Legionella sp. WA2024007413]